MILTIVLPTVISVIYYSFLASDVYISVSKFVVRSPDKPAASGLGVILKTVGFSNASDEIYAVQSYVVSRDALKTLNRDNAFEKRFLKPSISIFDRFNPIGLFGSFEDLYEYYSTKIHVEYDVSSAISTLSVRAYSAQDAHLINSQLLGLAESMVNRLNERGHDDMVKYATAEVEEAKVRAQNTSLAVLRFRNLSGIIDPERQAAIQMQMIAKLQDELVATKTRIAELRSLAPDNSQIKPLLARASSLRREIDDETADVAGKAQSLSSQAADYEHLQLENEVANKQLATAIASLQEARNEARRKQAYVERIVAPNLPDAPLQPRRVRGVLTTFLLGLVAWAILGMLIAGIREHRD